MVYFSRCCQKTEHHLSLYFSNGSNKDLQQSTIKPVHAIGRPLECEIMLANLLHTSGRPQKCSRLTPFCSIRMRDTSATTCCFVLHAANPCLPLNGFADIWASHCAAVGSILFACSARKARRADSAAGALIVSMRGFMSIR